MNKEETLRIIKRVTLCLMAHPDNEEGSEFDDMISDLEEIERSFESSKPQTPISEEETVNLIVKERDRACGIAKAFHEKHKSEFIARKKAGNDLAFVKEDMADVARLIGNTISGANGLTPDSETREDRIREEYKDELSKLSQPTQVSEEDLEEFIELKKPHIANDTVSGKKYLQGFRHGLLCMKDFVLSKLDGKATQSDKE